MRKPLTVQALRDLLADAGLRAADATQRPRGEGGNVSDRELLELAARAAGVCLHPPGKLHTSYGNWGSDTTCTVCGNDPSAARFAPLTDDGDALRLAVKLELEIYYGDDEGGTTVCVGYTTAAHAESAEMVAHKIELVEADPYAATRRAIVRAAAEIGKQMEETT